MKSLPDFVEFKAQQGTALRDIFTAASDDLLELLAAMLHWCPARRCSCSAALQMDYFKNKPYPTPPHLIPRPASLHPPNDSKKRLSDGISSIPKKLRFDENI